MKGMVFLGDTELENTILADNSMSRPYSSLQSMNSDLKVNSTTTLNKMLEVSESTVVLVFLWCFVCW